MNPYTPTYRIIILSNKDESQKPKKCLLPEKFAKRQQARNWLRNNAIKYSCEGFLIRHPDFTEEPYPSAKPELSADDAP